MGGLGLVVLAASAACGSAQAVGSARTGQRPAPDSATPSSQVSVPPACPEEGVSIKSGIADAAMGIRAMEITMVSCDGRTHRVNGYPAIRVLDEDFEPLGGIRLDRGFTFGDKDPGPRPLTLRPGDTARSVLSWRNTVTRTDVPAVRAPYLAVAPAAGAKSQTVRVDGGLDLGSTGRLGVTAWSVRPPR
ncbi:DUF4232 domain-containing protein [Actinomadura craniellae]|uniref:DUF4232 domain-containing protein n=2 Tax=Actinomadura craniellae TaxID=2231787 RepID=A0A365GWR0_9ACTN|nr:DUF4232 domain-containing protein [Actinomadura craniellae]